MSRALCRKMANVRIEKKFHLNSLQLIKFWDWMSTTATFTKSFPTRYVYSIYFDSLGMRSMNDNLSGQSSREKLRLRWYGDPSGLQNTEVRVQAELKFRRNGLGGKNTAELPTELCRLPDGNVKDLNGPLFDYLDERIGLPSYFYAARPQVRCGYERSYFEHESGIRLTFDKSLTFDENFSIECTTPGRNFFDDYVLEIKYPAEFTDPASDIMKTFPFTPSRYSKYLVGLAQFGRCVYI